MFTAIIEAVKSAKPAYAGKTLKQDQHHGWFIWFAHLTAVEFPKSKPNPKEFRVEVWCQMPTQLKCLKQRMFLTCAKRKAARSCRKTKSSENTQREIKSTWRKFFWDTLKTVAHFQLLWWHVVPPLPCYRLSLEKLTWRPLTAADQLNSR